MKKYKILLNGKMFSSNEWLEIFSPETNKVVGCVPILQENIIDQIFINAKKKFDSWSLINYKDRIFYIKEFAKILIKNKYILAEVMVNEIAKPFKEGVKEVERSYQYILETIEEFKTNFIKPKKLTNNNSKIAFLERVPLGVVLAISPFNYPVNLSLSKIIPALLLGNTVVFKPATQGSLSGALLSQYFKESNLPKHVFNIVVGKGSQIGDSIIKNKNIDMISFTGGFKVGNKIANEKPKIPLVLELGGKDPGIILEDANISKSISEIIKGSLLYSGQRCTAIKILYVHKSIFKKITNEVKKATAKLSIGTALENADITSLISKSSLEWATSLIKDAKNKGAIVELGDKSNGNILYPTILTGVKSNMKIFDEEQFAPIIPIVEYSNIEEVIKHVNNSKFGLQASIFTKDKKKFTEISKQLNCGTVNFNLAPSRGPDIFPFSGIKNSGFGIQGIYWSLESMSRIKLIVHK